MVNLRLMLMPIDGIGCGVETQGSRYWLLVHRITPHTLMAVYSGFLGEIQKMPFGFSILVVGCQLDIDRSKSINIQKWQDCAAGHVHVLRNKCKSLQLAEYCSSVMQFQGPEQGAGDWPLL